MLSNYACNHNYSYDYCSPNRTLLNAITIIYYKDSPRIMKSACALIGSLLMGYQSIFQEYRSYNMNRWEKGLCVGTSVTFNTYISAH